MTNEDLARLKALETAATPGPWAADGKGRCVGSPDDAIGFLDISSSNHSADAAFIAAARTAVPALIAEVERLRADNLDLLSAHDAQDMLMTNLRGEIERLTRDLSACSAHADALAQKLQVFERGHTCACSYDTPNDICGVHSPQLVAAREEVKRLENECFALAANQCHSGYGDDYGNHRCKYQDEVERLEKEKASLQRSSRTILDSNAKLIAAAGNIWAREQNIDRQIDGVQAANSILTEEVERLRDATQRAQGVIESFNRIKAGIRSIAESMPAYPFPLARIREALLALLEG